MGDKSQGNFRFAIFGGAVYYPSGGWDDLIGRYETAEEAFEVISGSRPYPDGYIKPSAGSMWWQIVDLGTGEEVSSGGWDSPKSAFGSW